MTIRSLTAGAALLLSTLAAAQAAPGQAATPVAEAKLADATPQQVHPIAAVDRDDDATCSRMRRRLWIEGEGWVVRRITTCR